MILFHDNILDKGNFLLVNGRFVLVEFDLLWNELLNSFQIGLNTKIKRNKS